MLYKPQRTAFILKFAAIMFVFTIAAFFIRLGLFLWILVPGWFGVISLAIIHTRRLELTNSAVVMHGLFGWKIEYSAINKAVFKRVDIKAQASGNMPSAMYTLVINNKTLSQNYDLNAVVAELEGYGVKVFRDTSG